MKRNFGILAFFVFLAVFVSPSHAQETITPQEAGKYIGQEKTVCGEVASASYTVIVEGEPTMLGFDETYPQKEAFQVVIWGADRPKFKEPPEDLYTGKKICVTGKITDSEGTAEIEVKDPSQIKVE